jgi:biopolymer transport protein ExbB
MKKLIALFTVFSIMAFGMTSMSWAAKTDKGAKETKVEAQAEEGVSQAADSNAQAGPTQTALSQENDPTSADEGLHTTLKNKFADGGPLWMTCVLISLIMGIAFSIERIFYLNLSDVNANKLLAKLDTALAEGGIAKAKDVCKEVRGPIATVFLHGLSHYDEGIESVEKAVIAHGGVAAGKMEKNLTWIGLFMAWGPSLGFMGTVLGMVQAFDDIEKQGDISPTVVAGGMKVALLTTVFGLITAIILQLFYNYILSRIDAIVNNMESATIEFMDMMSKYSKK